MIDFSFHSIMPRSGRLRRYIREFTDSSRVEKISFIPPFLILALELILLIHAATAPNLPDNLIIIELTSILLVISIIETILVSREIHEHYVCNMLDRILTIKLDDFILQHKAKNVKKIVEDFIELHPRYTNKRSEIYHICCQIMETHKEEAWEKELLKILKPFVNRRKQETVDSLLEEFLAKYPNYKKYRGETYEKICQLKG